MIPALQWLLVLSLFSWSTAIVTHGPNNWATQSWLFDWDSPGVDPTVSIPQTAQCEAINMHWSRASGNVPDYVPPFYLRIYTSTYPAPIVVDAGSDLNFTFVVPFAPGTQYQICMVDSAGNSGGCQASYTVYPNNTFAVDPKTKNVTIIPPVCANVTFPAKQINATGIDVNGPLTRQAWADQCTDISITPTNGTAPFVLTIAPTYHPPLNITSNTMDAINWTVTLGWAHQFYVSLVDANGYSWSTGPLHSGGNGKTDCLVLGGNSLGIQVSPSGQSGTSTGSLVGAIIGSLAGGVIIGLIASWWFSRRAKADGEPLRSGGSKDVEPYTLPNLPNDHEDPQSASPEDPTMSGSESPNSPRVLPSGMMRQTSDASSHQVYLVHHDGGRPPISVYHPEGASIVELPPSYGPQRTDDGQGPPEDERTATSIGTPTPSRVNRRAVQHKMRVASTDSTADSV